MVAMPWPDAQPEPKHAITEPMSDAQAAIVAACEEVKAMLLEKNRNYGNSALAPQRIFSKATSVEQLLVRIDDKISRIATKGFSAMGEDTLMDLIGYLILLRVATTKEVSA